MDENARLFLEWLTENGAKYPNGLEFFKEADSGTGYSVRAIKKKTEEHEFIIEIPTKLMITPPLVKKEMPEINGNPYFTDEASDDILLSLFLMHEKLKGAKSFFYPYLQVLPAPSCITEWPDDFLTRELQDDSLMKACIERRKLIKSEYETLMEHLPSATTTSTTTTSNYSFDLFKWAYLSVQSRCFGRRLNYQALVPLCDSLNHGNVKATYDYNKLGSDKFRLFCGSSPLLKKNTKNEDMVQVLNSYGRRSNEYLLLEYGFALENNEWDYVELTLAFPEDDIISMIAEAEHSQASSATAASPATSPKITTKSSKETSSSQQAKYKRSELYYQMTALLGPYSDSEKMKQIAMKQAKGGPGGGPGKLTTFNPSSILLRYFRVLNADSSDITSYQNAGALEDFFSQFVSKRNEIKALSGIIETCEAFLKAHPTTLEEDSILLKEYSDTTTTSSTIANGEEMMYALRYRIGRKRVITMHCDFAKKLLNLITTKLTDEPSSSVGDQQQQTKIRQENQNRYPELLLLASETFVIY